MINIEIYEKTYLMPETWNELSSKQLIEIAGIINRPQKSFKDKIYLLRTCMGISTRTFINYGYLPSWLNQKLFWKKIEVLLFFERSLYLVDFLLKENCLTKQLIGVLGKFHAPADNFENLLMSEFCWSEYWYLKYKEEKSLEAITNLVATLYRPARENYDQKKNPAGDLREPFNVHLTKQYAARLQKQPLDLLQAVVIWYEGCRFNLVKSFPKVFSGKSGDGQSFGLFSLITGVAEDGVMGDFDKVNGHHVQVVLLRLTQLIIRAEELEAEIEAAKTKQ